MTEATRGRGHTLVWCALTLGVLFWPAKIPGLFDGAPLDGAAEAVIAGLVVPVLCWFHHQFFRSRAARLLVVALVLVRIADAQMAQGGWCVRFDTPEQIVRDGTGRPHSWDVRADWRAPDPACSAVMTSGWDVFKRFPVWFYNMPPTDGNAPEADDRPPYVTLKMTVLGYLDAGEQGSLDLQVGRYTTTSMMVDGRPAEANGEGAYRIDVGPGLHLIQIDNTLQANEWRFMPSFNQAPFGTRGFPLVTVERPLSRDRGWLRTVIGASSSALAIVLVLAWLVSALRAWGDVTTIAWAVAASAWLAYLAPRPGTSDITSPLAKWSVTALALAALLPMRDRLRTLRGAFVVIGIPWLVFIGVAAFDHLAKFSFYAGGDDQWTFQRAAYRIYLQGYWLEGGEPTFWFQPGYRWVAGALHMLFGDSSLGEFHWDGICLAIMALFAHEAVSRAAGFKWGLVAAATVLTLVMQGPPWIYWGTGLSEHAAAGFIYGAALVAMLANTWRLRVAAGALAVLGFFVRLNNLPIAFAIAVFAIPLRCARARSVGAAAMARSRRLAHCRRDGRCRAHWNVPVRTADLVLHRCLLIFSRHHFGHQCDLAAWHGDRPGAASHGRQCVDGLVDERSAAVRLVCHTDDRRRGVRRRGAGRCSASSQLAAAARVVFRRRLVGRAGCSRRSVFGTLLDDHDRHRVRDRDQRDRSVGARRKH